MILERIGTMAGRVWGKKARNREVIMEAAKALFEREGMERVTFNDIAEEAGMSRTTIFNHFPTINDLLLALAEQEFQSIMDYYVTTRLSGRELIMAMFNRLIDDTCDFPVLTTRLISTILIVDSERQTFSKFLDMIEENLDPAFPEEEREEIAIMLTGNYFGLIGYNFFRHESFNRSKMKKHFAVLASKIF